VLRVVIWRGLLPLRGGCWCGGAGGLVLPRGRGWEDGRGLPVSPGLLWDASPFL